MVKNTLNVGRISEGFVLDHIEAGKSMEIYKYLNLDKLDAMERPQFLSDAQWDAVLERKRQLLEKSQDFRK